MDIRTGIWDMTSSDISLYQLPDQPSFLEFLESQKYTATAKSVFPTQKPFSKSRDRGR